VPSLLLSLHVWGSCGVFRRYFFVACFSGANFRAIHTRFTGGTGLNTYAYSFSDCRVVVLLHHLLNARPAIV